jgi:hypothetical protein
VHPDPSSGTVDSLDMRVLSNGSTVVPGSEISINDGSSTDIFNISHTFTFEASAGDYVTLQSRRNVELFDLVADSTFTLWRIDGVQGDTGLQGVTGPAGGPQGETGLQGPQGETGVSGVFGDHFAIAENLVSDTSSSSTYIQHNTIATGTVPAGTYRVGYEAVLRNSDTGGDFGYRVQIDNTTTLITVQEEAKDPNTDQRCLRSGFAYITFGSSGSHNIDLDFNQPGGPGTTTIEQSRLEFWRTS